VCALAVSDGFCASCGLTSDSHALHQILTVDMHNELSHALACQMTGGKVRCTTPPLEPIPVTMLHSVLACRLVPRQRPHSVRQGVHAPRYSLSSSQPLQLGVSCPSERTLQPHRWKCWFT